MAGLLRKSMLYLGLVDDEGDYDEHDGYDDEAEPARARRREPAGERVGAVRTHPDGRGSGRGLEPRGGGRTAVTAVAFDHDDEEDPLPSTPMSRPPERLARITTLHPRTYNDARTIGEQFRAAVPVIMDLTDMDDADAKRLVDFAAGLTFGLRGRIEKVTRSVFLLSPEGIAVQLDDAAGVVEGGFYNQS